MSRPPDPLDQLERHLPDHQFGVDIIIREREGDSPTASVNL